MAIKARPRLFIIIFKYANKSSVFHKYYGQNPWPFQFFFVPLQPNLRPHRAIGAGTGADSYDY